MNLNIFLIAAGILFAVTIAAIWRGVFGHIRIRNTDATELNIEIGKQRLAELESTNVDQQEKIAIEQALLDDLHGQSGSVTNIEARPLPKILAAFVIVLIPLTSVGIYLGIGNIESFVASEPAAQSATIDSLSDEDQQTLNRLLTDLESKLAQNPNDIEGWSLAARTYMSVGVFDKAVSAFDNLNRLEPDDPDILSGYADAVIMMNGNRYTDLAQQLIAQVLQLDPNHPNALWISALGSLSLGNTDSALGQLEHLKEVVSTDAASVQRVDRVIAGILSQVQSNSDNSGSASSQQKGTDESNTSSEITRLTVSIDIDEKLRTVEYQNATLFVTAKSVSGPPAPVAALKLNASQIPLQVTLSDENAMLAGHNLSSQERVDLEARISFNGNAIAVEGDLYGEIKNVSLPNDQPLNIVIDRVKGKDTL